MKVRPAHDTHTQKLCMYGTVLATQSHLASKSKEGFGQFVIVALFCGLPIATLRVDTTHNVMKLGGGEDTWNSQHRYVSITN